jgi:FMN phosphatase YigB (HAD superfamily)
MNDDYFQGFSDDLHDAARWQTFYKREQARDSKLPSAVPPVPILDASWLFNEMMKAADHPDPWMFPALKRLKASGKYILAALSNTVIFPPDHPMYSKDYLDDPVRGLFDVFMSSAHIGIRKPDPAMYWYARHRLNEYAKMHAETPRGKELGWAAGVLPEDILFLDDIGENLKEARRQGFGTIKASLGRAFEAVDELEKVTGLELAGEYPRIPIKPKFTVGKAKM